MEVDGDTRKALHAGLNLLAMFAAEHLPPGYLLKLEMYRGGAKLLLKAPSGSPLPPRKVDFVNAIQTAIDHFIASVADSQEQSDPQPIQKTLPVDPLAAFRVPGFDPEVN